MSGLPRAADVKAFDAARDAGDVDAMAAAALRLADGHVFGTVPGRIPAFLHEAYQASTGRRRVQLAVAIARTWAYGGSPERATEFATEALAGAEQLDDPVLLAQALDAQLLVRWGPDQLDDRLAITDRLEETVAHIADPEARMTAHLWRLTVALECLDVPTMRRQLRALDQLADDVGTPRHRFFAASRRAMYALLVGDIDLARRAHHETVEAGNAAGEPDTFPLDQTLTAEIARQAGDIDTITRQAAVYEAFGEQEAVASVAAEGSRLWALAGDVERASRQLHELAGADFSRIPRDVDWLLTVTSLTETASMVGARELLTHAAQLLTPYAGRGVANAGAVGFAGVVDHYVAMALTALHDDSAEKWWGQAAAAYRRVGAQWWLRRCQDVAPTTDRGVTYLRAVPSGLWEIGRAGQVNTVRDMKGLHYLQLLLQRPNLELPALALSDAVSGHPGERNSDTTLGPVIDRAAATSYRRRLAEIDSELDEARSWADDGRAAALATERESLLDELRGAAGLGGRLRETGGSAERARVAVRKAVAAAIARIDELDPSLSRLLRDTVTTGSTCRYAPDPDRPVEWVLD